MKAKELAKILAKINLPHFFTKKGRLAFYTVEHKGYIILVGIYLDSTMDKESFFIEYFIQPLFIPFPTFCFSIGERIGGYWTIKDIKEIEDKLIALDKIKSFEEISLILSKKFRGFKNTYFYQLAGFLKYFKGDFSGMQKDFEKIIQENHTEPPLEEWREKEIAQAKAIIKMLHTEEKLHSTLKAWQDETILNLNMVTYFT